VEFVIINIQACALPLASFFNDVSVQGYKIICLAFLIIALPLVVF